MLNGLLNKKKKLVAEVTLLGWLLIGLEATFQAVVGFIVVQVCERLWAKYYKKGKKHKKHLD